MTNQTMTLARFAVKTLCAADRRPAREGDDVKRAAWLIWTCRDSGAFHEALTDAHTKLDAYRSGSRIMRLERTIASLKDRVSDLSTENDILHSENAHLNAQIPDEWKLHDENRTRRQVVARRIWRERAHAWQTLADATPKVRASYLQVQRRDHMKLAGTCQRDTFPQDLARCMTKVTRLLDYSRSSFDDRGSCGYGDYLSELRNQARQDAQRGYAIASVL